MLKRWWAAGPAALVLAGVLALGGGVGAQNSTVPDDNPGLVAEIHQGTCANLTTTVAFQIGDLTRTGTSTLGSNTSSNNGFAGLGSGLVGAPDTAPVWTARKTIDASADDLFGGTTSYAIVVGEPGANGAVAACGDLGGVVNNNEIAVALLPGTPVQVGILAGVAVFNEPLSVKTSDADATETATAGGSNATNRTSVTVYAFRLATAPTETATSAASPVATIAPTLPPTETATAATTATAAATGTVEVTGTSAVTVEATSTVEATVPGATETPTP